ncbi:immediate early response 3-interacting protein 1 [Grammomys surdaster]|nr:immediate early response 3-interacting protein 1 [Grammomys surdaster]
MEQRGAHDIPPLTCFMRHLDKKGNCTYVKASGDPDAWSYTAFLFHFPLSAERLLLYSLWSTPWSVTWQTTKRGAGLYKRRRGCSVSAFRAARASVAGRGRWRRHVPGGVREEVSRAWGQFEVTMAFTLYSLMQAALLCVNAIAVLHEERFLKNIGWGTDQGIGGFGEEPGIKSQLMNLIRSVRTVMRVPLIIVNSITIVLLLLFG